MPNFEMPSVLQNRSARDFYEKIKAILPKDMDLSEANHYWNLTYPVALVAAEICEFVLPEVVRIIMPEGSYGEFLEGHARERALFRKAAVAATGELKITAPEGTIIPKGSLFSTASTNTAPSVDYATLIDVTIGAEGIAYIPIECTQAGRVGNAGPETIIFVTSRLRGIEAVTNPEPTTGGNERESDDELIARIIEYDQTQGQSYIGNNFDYKRWAMSVDGVGSATIIPAQDDTGLVSIILTDLDGKPANDALLEDVYNLIMRPDNPELRLAPINAYLSVIAPDTCNIAIKATIELEEEATVEGVIEKFEKALIAYLPEALEDEEVKYSKIWGVLSNVKGVADFANLLIGVKDAEGNVSEYGTSNIPVSKRLLPVVSAEDLLLIEGIV